MSWDPSFFRRNPLFWPIVPAAAALEHLEAWPAPDDLTRALGPEPPVRFEPAAPKPRRRPRAPGTRYDARIAMDRVVPTRARSWHDLLNALVWASFPRAKLALHGRQHRLIAARVGEDLRLPGARTAEQDAVAMLDEGGVVLLHARRHGARVARALEAGGGEELAALVAEGEACAIVFGHAIYEGLVCGGPASVRAAAYVVERESIDQDERGRVAAADEALAALLARDAPVDRRELPALVVDERLARATASSAGSSAESADARSGHLECRT